MSNPKTRAPILSGLRVLDVAHQYSAANTCAILADLGADVVSVEHPSVNPIRTMLPKKDGQSMWLKVAHRGKRHVTLNLSKPRGREIFLKMIKDFDVLVENFRPGTMEKWGIGPADLEKAGANLTMLRISGFGQTGPYREWPGFGTAAEAMSGFANMNGYPDGPPTFPSTTLADGVASLWGVIGVLAGLLGNLRQGTQKGVEVADVALFEGLFRIIPTQVPTFQQTGYAQRRPGNYLGEHGVLRNVYGSKDGKYFIVSAVGPAAIRRIMVGAGCDEMVKVVDGGIMDDHGTDKIQEFLARCNEHLLEWAPKRNYDELTADLSAAGAVFAPVYGVEDIMKDPQYQARDDLVTLDDPDLGPLTMQGIVPKFPGRDHKIRHAGGARGRDNEAYFGGFGISPSEIAALKEEGVM